MEAITTTHIYAPDFRISTVTVYMDRAEVNRSIPLKLKPGLTEVHIENIAAKVIEDSIRVDGKGNATIHEVQFKKKHLSDIEITNQKIESLEKEKKQLTEQKASLEDTNAVVEKQLASINELILNFGKTATLNDGKQTVAANHFDASAEQSLEALYAFHERKAKQLKERVRAGEKDRDELSVNIEKLATELKELKGKARTKKSVVVTLQNDAKVESGVELVLSYQVKSASWVPSYDVRVNLGQNKDKEQIQMTYFGNITQKSGEEWKDVNLVLSTAQPNAGRLPRLGTTVAQFKRPEPQYSPRVACMRARAQCAEVDNEYKTMASMDEGSDEDEEELERFTSAETTAEDKFLTTNFSIAQTKTIPDDNTQHKVTIAVLHFNSVPLRYDCVPSKDTNVFISAVAINATAYPLLKGLVSIYVNNCFTQKAHFDSVLTGDRFSIPLGVCPTIKVVYKPTHKHHHQTGLLTKSSNLVHEQKIVLKNTNNEAVLVTLMEPIPKSADEKIKIRLLSPSDVGKQHEHNGVAVVDNMAKGGEGSRRASTATTTTTLSTNDHALRPALLGARLNGDNNLEWGVLVSGGGNEMELVVKWEAEFPANEKLELKEVISK